MIGAKEMASVQLVYKKRLLQSSNLVKFLQDVAQCLHFLVKGTVLNNPSKLHYSI